MTRSMRMNALRTGAVVVLASLAFIQCGGDQKSADSPASTMPSAEPPPSDEADAATTRSGTPSSDSLATERNAPPADTDSSSAKSAAPKAEALSDEQIAAITEAANTAEIEQAKLARTKSKDAAVKRFAAMMIAHHGEAKQKQAKLKLKPEDSGTSTALQADAASTLNTLKTEQGKDFDLG